MVVGALIMGIIPLRNRFRGLERENSEGMRKSDPDLPEAKIMLSPDE